MCYLVTVKLYSELNISILSPFYTSGFKYQSHVFFLSHGGQKCVVCFDMGLTSSMCHYCLVSKSITLLRVLNVQFLPTEFNIKTDIKGMRGHSDS